MGSVKGKENDKLKGRKVGQWKLYFSRDVIAVWLMCMLDVKFYMNLENCWICENEMKIIIASRKFGKDWCLSKIIWDNLTVLYIARIKLYGTYTFVQ